MKILVISNYYPPHYIGGYELACFNTVEYLKNCGHELFVLTGNHKQESDEISSVYRKLKYIDYKNPSFLNKHNIEVYNYNLTKQLIEMLKPDLVYLWSLRLISLSPAIAVQDLKSKKIFEIGDFWMKGYFSNTLFSKIKRGLKNILPFTIGSNIEFSPAICVSNWLAKEMKTKYKSKELHIIPNGTKIQKHKKNTLSTKIKYMFCGRIDHTKGLDLALKALGNIKQRGINNFVFHIYGEGDNVYINKCKSIIKVLNLTNEVVFCGKKEDIQKYYPLYNILLMPTRMREPFGLVIIEAMAAGVVPIATNAYGPAEIIDNYKNGLLFKSENIEDLSTKILELHTNNHLYNKLSLTGLKSVSERFDLQNVKREVENILLKTVQKDLL